jgi:hypothetical protein
VFGTADQMVIPVFFDETGANGSLSCVLQLHFSQVIGRPGNEKLMPQMVTMNQLSENEQSLLGMLTLSESGVKPCTLFWPEGFVPTELVFELRIVISGHNLSCPIKVKYSLAELSDQYEPIYYDILLSSRENELSLKPVCNAIGRDGWRRTIELGASESTVLFEEVVCE